MSRFCNVPLTMPRNFPEIMTTTLKAQRLLTVAAAENPAKLEDLTRSLFSTVFGSSHAPDLSDDAVLRAACASAGLDARQADEFVGIRLLSPDFLAFPNPIFTLLTRLMVRVDSPETKARLKATTNEAIEHGVRCMTGKQRPPKFSPPLAQIFPIRRLGPPSS